MKGGIKLLYLAVILIVILLAVTSFAIIENGTNSGRSDVYVIGALNDTVFGLNLSSGTSFLIANNIFPQGMAISPNGKYGYISCGFGVGEGNVLVFDTSTRAIVNSINIGPNNLVFGPIIVSPDGQRLYVSAINYSKYGTQNISVNAGSVLVINTTTNQLIYRIRTVGNPINMALSPDGKSLYIANIANGTISVIDTTTGRIISNITVMSDPFSITVSNDGRFAYVANMARYTYFNGMKFYNYSFSIINLTNNRVTNMTIGRPFNDSSFGSEGDISSSIAVNPDNDDLIYLANILNGTILIVNTSDGKISSIALGDYGPGSIAISSDGKYIYVAHGSNFSIIITKTDFVRSIPTKYNGDSVVIQP